MSRLCSLALLAALSWSAVPAVSEAQVYDPNGPRIINYNLYANGESDIVAQAHPAPRPTPPYVGHTYITYEPLAPHEFLYRHRRTYSRSHRDGGRTTTRVWWW